MKFATLLDILANEPVFETGILLAGSVDKNDVQRQLSRWKAAGKIQQLRRGLYALAPPYRRLEPHPFEIANQMVRGSYVSLHSALEHHGLIPERTARITSVGGSRPQTWQTPLGTFEFRCLQPEMMMGFDRIAVGDGRSAAVATPEKALLDLAYLQAGGDEPSYLRSLRLQNLEIVNVHRLSTLAESSGKPKLTRVAGVIEQLAAEDSMEYQDL